MFNVYLITPDDGRFYIVKSIREEVFVNEQGVSIDEEFDSFDEYGAPCVFALLYEDEEAVGTARLVVSELGYKIGRIAVLKSVRGKRYGELLVKTLLNKAFSMGAKEVNVDSQINAVPFYEKIGFVLCGEQITERGILHIPMKITQSDLQKCGGCHG